MCELSKVRKSPKSFHGFDCSMLLGYFSFAWKYFPLDAGRQAKILQNCTKSDFASNMGFICLEI
jgi:hypothetical protein